MRNEKGLARVILALAIPTMLEQLMASAVQYIDTAMVGTLGTQATAAVGATGTVGWLVYGVIAAFGIGFLAIISQACGAGQPGAARHAAAQSVLVVLTLGTVFTAILLSLSKWVPVWMQVDPAIQSLAASYFFILYLPMLPRTASTIFGTVLRAAGDTRTPMKVGILVNLINVVLNFLLIYPTRMLTLGSFTFRLPGAGWGVIGAAAASAIAFAWGGIHITWVLWHHPQVSPRGEPLMPDLPLLKRCLRISFPNILQRFGTSFGYVVFASMINSIGEVATAAHTIANTVESAFYIPGYGMQTAAATLTGNAYGARDREKMNSLASLFVPIEIVLMLFSGGALFAFAPRLMDLFSDNPEVIAQGALVLRMVALSEPLYGFSIIVEGMMLGVGKTKAPFLYNIIGMWGIRIVGTFLFTQLLNGTLTSAWACMISHNVFLFVLYLIAYLRGTWNPLNRE